MTKKEIKEEILFVKIDVKYLTYAIDEIVGLIVALEGLLRKSKENSIPKEKIFELIKEFNECFYISNIENRINDYIDEEKCDEYCFIEKELI